MNWILLISAVVVAWLVISWLINVVKTTLTTALAIAAIVVILYLSIGIGPQELVQQILSLPQLVLEKLRG
jgi:hypothetical protein